MTETGAAAGGKGGMRPGEIALPFDPAAAADAGVAFIGRIRSPWRRDDPDSCPKNVRQARERGLQAVIELDPRYRDGLADLREASPIVVLYWMDGARRDLMVQSPRHRDGSVGVFSLRSPARPNPVAMAVVTLLAIDPAACTLTIDAIDCFDGTPLIDLKPWLPRVDIPDGYRDAEP
jgi:tRNA-Thr(GGU) m(6)t(6)A37 methyltransferase TsaA